MGGGGGVRGETVIGKGAMYHHSSGKPVSLVCIQCAVCWEANEVISA